MRFGQRYSITRNQIHCYHGSTINGHMLQTIIPFSLLYSLISPKKTVPWLTLDGNPIELIILQLDLGYYQCSHVATTPFIRFAFSLEDINKRTDSIDWGRRRPRV